MPALTVAKPLPRSSPESVGISPAAIFGFLDAIEAGALELHSLMILRHGKVCAEGWWAPYSAERPHILYSLSKSFTSTALGILADEGKISIDDPVVSFFPDDLPEEPSENLLKMRVRDLLTMTAGHDHDDMSELYNSADQNWPRAFLRRPVPYEPGTHFLYNTSATYMCSAILTQITGESVFAYLTPRLFDPLGIEGAFWTTDPQGRSVGGTGLSVRTEDIAKFGSLYAQKGLWGGRRLISEAWIDRATSGQVSNGTDPNNDWNQGYGFQFWRCRHHCYRGDGAFGQFCIVIPETDMVIAMTSSTNNMGGIMQAVWDHLRYAPQPAPITESGQGEALRERLATLQVAGPRGARSSPIAGEISGREFVNENPDRKRKGVTFEFLPDVTLTSSRYAGVTHTTRIGTDSWEVNPGRKGSPEVGLRGAWTSEDAFVTLIKRLDGPETHTIECKFEGDSVTAKETSSGSFAADEGRTFRGRR